MPSSPQKIRRRVCMRLPAAPRAGLLVSRRLPAALFAGGLVGALTLLAVLLLALLGLLALAALALAAAALVVVVRWGSLRGVRALIGEAATARRDRCPRRLAAGPRRPRRARPASHASRADRRRALRTARRPLVAPSAKRRPRRVTIARVRKQITLRVRCACDGRWKPIPRNVGQGYQRHVVAKHLSTRSRRSCQRRAL